MQKKKNLPLTVWDQAIWQFKGKVGLFSNYPEVSDHFKLHEYIGPVVTLGLTYRQEIPRPDTFHQAIFGGMLDDKVESWISAGICDEEDVRAGGNYDIPLTASLLLYNTTHPFIFNHAHFLAHAMCWQASWCASCWGNRVPRFALDSASVGPENLFAPFSFRIFCGVDPGPDLGSFATKIWTLGLLSLALLKGDRVAANLHLDWWRVLFQEPDIVINTHDQPWSYFFGHPFDPRTVIDQPFLKER